MTKLLRLKTFLTIVKPPIVLKRTVITITETVIKPVEIINPPTPSIFVETQAPIIGSATNQTPFMDDLSKMIAQNGNDLDQLADKLNKYKEKNITQKEENEEALQSSSSRNQKTYQETVSETSNVELDNLTNRLQTPTNITLEDNLELDGINQVMDEIKLAATVTTEVLTNQLKKHSINLEKTEEANKRTASLYKRAEELLRSVENPGRIAKYTLFGITIGYTIYNIVRYGQIPFSGLLGGISSSAAANAVNHSVSPNIAPTINVNFPALVTPSVPIATPPMGEFMQGFINSPWLGVTLVGIGYILKHLRR